MKLNIISGDDVQRSSNLAANRCVNLYPVTNNDGSIVGFYLTPGLTLYTAIQGGDIASGIYKASNGRCFFVAGTTLYELTTGAVITSRGTVTYGTVTRYIDNGIDLQLVQGVDSWLFTFATNTLRKLKVKQAVFTVTIASPAVFTSVAHTLVAGDRINLSSTGLLPTGLDTSTTYWVISTGLTADAFQVSLTEGGSAINTTGTQSGVHTFTTIGYGFPEGCKTIQYMNGRGIASDPNTRDFYCSEVRDLHTWDVLNVQNADSNPDNIVGEYVSNNELIIFCTESGEIFNDTGTIPSPFQRNQSATFEMGCVAPYSIAGIDNSVYWLGRNEYGQGVVYRLNGYTPVKVSDYARDYAIQQMTTISDAIAFTYQQDGHHFYILTFPTGGRTFCLDINTGLWHERSGWDSGGGVFTRWEAQEYAFFDGKHLVCDYVEGNIYYIDHTSYLDGTETRKWLRSFTAPATDMKRVRHRSLEFHFETGVGVVGGSEPTIMVKWSDDGGHTWSSEVWRTLGIGSVGEYAKRVKIHRLGITKGVPRIYEVSGTAAVKIVLLGAYLE